MKQIKDVYFRAIPQHPLGPRFQDTKYVAKMLIDELTTEQLQDVHMQVQNHLNQQTAHNNDTTCLLGEHDVK